MSDALDDFRRIRDCTDGFRRRIIPPLVINDDIELDRLIATDRPRRCETCGHTGYRTYTDDECICVCHGPYPPS